MAPANGWIYRRLKVRSREGFLVEQHGKQCMIRELFELPLAPFNSLGWATQAKLFVFRNLPVQCYIYIYCISIYLSIYLYLRTVGAKAKGVEGSEGRGGRAATQRFCATSAKCCWLSQPNTKKHRLSYCLL